MGYKPGVTDNVGRTAREAVELLLQRKFTSEEGVYTSILYLLKGKIDRGQAETIATGLLANTLIQRFAIKDRASWDPKEGMGAYVPKVAGEKRDPGGGNRSPASATGELLRISSERTLALSLKEMKALQAYAENPRVREERKKVGLGENLTDCEVEALAQTWSEHCKHKIFNAQIDYRDENRSAPAHRESVRLLHQTLHRRNPQGDGRQRTGAYPSSRIMPESFNSIRIGTSYSKLKPITAPPPSIRTAGALTGIVGVNRDPFGTGKGAKLIFNVDTFCFAPPDYAKPLPPRLLHPKRVYEGVREGVEHGGNKSGIPTVNGSIVFDERFLGKPLVYCGTGGIMPRKILGEAVPRKTGPAGGLDRHDRRADRKRRDSRSHLLLRGASRRIPYQRRADRRSHHPETDDRFPSAGPRSRAYTMRLRTMAPAGFPPRWARWPGTVTDVNSIWKKPP